MTASEINWANLPKKIIRKIGSNINKGFLVNIRLVNKHWLDSLNELVFYSLENWSPESIPKLIKNHCCCIKSWYPVKNEEYTQLIIDNVKSLERIDWYEVHEPISALNKLITKFPTIRVLNIKVAYHYSEDDEDEEDEEAKKEIQAIKDLFKLVKNLKHLDTFNFETHLPILHRLADCIKDMNLKNLTVKGSSEQTDPIWKAYNSSPNLKSFTLSSYSYIGNNGEPTRETVISPNSFDFHSRLEHISLNTIGDNDPGYMYDYYAKELLSAFENPKFKQLKSFTWVLDSYVNTTDVNSLTFTPANITPKHFPNLTFLSLELCDSHLLSLISKQFPNLVQLNLSGSLTLPNSESGYGSFKRLNKLAFSGYDKAIIKSPSIIQSIFPVVSTLKLRQFNIESKNYTNNLCNIPIIFPNLKKLICDDYDDEWHTLLDTKDSYNWEELYIRINSEEHEKISKLITKLPKLKILYLFDFGNELKSTEFKYNGDACIIRANDIEVIDYSVELFNRLY